MARLRPLTRTAGLSLGDHDCLALAERLGVPALTTGWVRSTLSLGIATEVLR
ncbi:hypothetical protein ACFP9V_25470 [Deinococcus radiopugnans]|uniref:PIN domain nuclease of toxin-antitoxin system n=1 Tax=Deinococcus radiopugnans ATCC 19172 TaxID=585398 RepID=A0ABR6NWW5_9DEIO|nr:hypothetical protein [Deinococcus radiopugnans]MBB6018538.1 PIN domain nuclease of toxin-antitoxin system [Deinococcus radiopugnans ATCC 19172]